MDMVIFNAFRKAGLNDEQAQAVVEAVHKSIDERYKLHSEKIATKGDLMELETRLTRLIAENQRWTVTTMVACLTIFAAVIKLL
jgi:hypothetical protein